MRAALTRSARPRRALGRPRDGGLPDETEGALVHWGREAVPKRGGNPDALGALRREPTQGEQRQHDSDHNQDGEGQDEEEAGHDRERW